MSPITIFYADKVYEECDRLTHPELVDLPDGVYIYFREPAAMGGQQWYLKDLTPVLLEDVPKALRAWVLIL